VPVQASSFLVAPCAPGAVVEHQQPITGRTARELVADHQISCGSALFTDRGSVIRGGGVVVTASQGIVEHQQRGVHHHGAAEAARLPAGRR